MRRLIVMRHAKSSWSSPAGTDHERPLNARGRRSAPLVAKALRDRGWAPEWVISSDAKRTRETWAGMALELPEALEVRFTRRLYLAGLKAMARELCAVPDPVHTVLVLGHNPGWEDAATALSRQPLGMKTGYAVLLETESPTWAEAPEGLWRLSDVIRPREL